MAQIAGETAAGHDRRRNAIEAPAEPESISGYFRTFFRENPRLVKIRSNAEVLCRWLADHPGEKDVPQRVKRCWRM